MAQQEKLPEEIWVRINGSQGADKHKPGFNTKFNKYLLGLGKVKES
ncbi:hypothetical protein MuYL_3626 [Mucilaginibacter xinganensis]|uniref:Uncharacterized protein n=1 Tax=Mucilaginibacter xinganensis TaxID=1234841 RepID=A0A223P0Z2_9SPHI|nr:hypothetical protein MuYL_3626 [Mucilaginibacter xinganensis]